MRALANISKQYLFDETPTEVICLLFWLVVIYAVSGSFDPQHSVCICCFFLLLLIFITIWVMAIFSTTVIAFDVGIVALHSIAPRIHKMNWIFILSPIIYIISMLPSDKTDIDQFGVYLSNAGIVFSAVIPVSLLLLAKIRGVR